MDAHPLGTATGRAAVDRPVAPPRLVASDIDGTLLRSDGTLSPRTAAALRAAEAAGATVVLVTGRPARWLPDVADAAGLTGLAICANGALVHDLGTGRAAATHPIGAETAQRVAGLLREARPGVAFAMEGPDGFAREPHYVTRFDARTDQRVAPVPRLFDRDVLKLLVRDEAVSSDQLLAAVTELVGDLVTPTHSAAGAGGGLVEISARGVSKGTTLAALCAERGLGRHDVVAFGDMPNDLPLLAWAGRAYAVANAHPDVLAAVGSTTASNDEDGVAQVLERWFG